MTTIISSIEPTSIMNTTISVSIEMKERLRSLGRSGESYDDIIRRLCDQTHQNILERFLYDDSNSYTIEEARAEAERLWPKSISAKH